MAEAPNPPAAAHTSQCDRAIITPPARTAAAMIPRYPTPTSGIEPSVAGRSTTWIIASAASATAPTARAIRSVPYAGAGPRRASIGVLLLWDRSRAAWRRDGAAVVSLSTTHTNSRDRRVSRNDSAGRAGRHQSYGVAAFT